MGNINISPWQSDINFEPNRESQSISEASNDLGLLAQHPKALGAMQFISETGLPVIYNAEVIKSFLLDPADFKAVENYEAIFRNLAANLPESQFKAIFREFCEDQVVKKGYFEPKEAYDEWPSYVEERNESSLQMKRVAERFAADTPSPSQKTSGATNEISAPKASLQPLSRLAETENPAGINANSISSEIAGAKAAAEVENASSDPLLYMTLVLQLLIDVTTTMQEIAMTQAAQLEVETQKQEAYITIQEHLVTINPNSGLFKDSSSDEALDAISLWNNTILPTLQEQLRSYKDVSQERSKTINSKINETTTAIEMLSNIFSDILGKISSIGMSIVR